MILSDTGGEMSEQASQEPTMEEILASIRRIISEDEAPADEHAPEAAVEESEAEPAEEAPAEPEAAQETPVEAAAEAEDVLELTEKVEEAETIGDLEVSEADEPAAETPAPAPAPAPAAAAAPAEPDEPLVSAPTAAAVTSAFGQLQHRIGMPAPTQTLDSVVRELLRPLLKEWLDQHLKTIVEAKVEEEVERQARRLRG